MELIRDTNERNAANLISRYSKILKVTNREYEIDLKGSMKTFSVPFDIFCKSRKRKKVKIDIILDISGSIVKSAEILILFTYFHKRFPSQVRFFYLC